MLFYFLISLISIDSFSQNTILSTLRARETLSGVHGGLTGSEILYGVPMAEPTLVGDSYFNKDWKKASVALYENENLITGYWVRFELLKNELEIKTKTGVKVLEGDRIKGFVLTDSVNEKPTYFINAKDYKLDQRITIIGFLEVLVEGKYILVKKNEASIRKSDYNMKLDVGNRNDEIIRSSSLFYLQGSDLKKAPNTKSSVVELFADKSNDIQKYIKVNKLNLKLQDHLEALFKYYNSL